MRRWIVTTLLAVALVAAGACDDKQQPTATAPTAPTTTTTTPTTTPQAGAWRGLTIARENRCSPYDADDYSYPQSVEDDIVRDLGGIYSPYTCESFDSDTETDIEHIVARSEAHDPGLCRADAGTRREFRARPACRHGSPCHAVSLDVCKTENQTRDTTHGGTGRTAPSPACLKRAFAIHADRLRVPS